MSNISRQKQQQQAKILRTVRKAHRVTGITLLVFFLLVAVTGVLLGWKKNSAGWLLPTTQKGSSTTLSEWLPISDLEILAQEAINNTLGQGISTELSRIDIRKNKGSLKFVYKKHFWEVQLDGQTGNLLSLAERRSDWLENLHDGSFMDDYWGTKGLFKLLYTTVMGLALLLFVITGFWLWYGPKRMRQQKK